jgi:hypothetical protein
MTDNDNHIIQKEISGLKINTNYLISANTDIIKKLAQLIDNYKFNNCIIINKDDEIIYGFEILEAAKEAKQTTVDAIKLDIDNDKEPLFLLELTDINQNTDSMLTSKLIFKAIERGTTRKEICKTLNKSKSWLSKIEVLYKYLNKNVELLVENEVITPKTAVLISKLPPSIQPNLANVVARDDLTNEEVKYIVDLCMTCDNNSDMVKIIDDSNCLLDNKPEKSNKNKKDKNVASGGIVNKILNTIIFQVDKLIGVLQKLKIYDKAAIIKSLKLILDKINNLIDKLNDDT